jgi:AcrR family transcriptional regulator
MPNSRRPSQGARTFTEEARRQQIVAAAIETIAEHGYADASLERIAQRVGISRGLISYHFEGRADLMAAVVSTVFAEGTAYMRPHLERASTATERLEAALRSNLEFMRDRRAHVVAVAEIARAGGRGEMGSGRSGIQRAVAALEGLLRAGQASGEFGAFDPHVMAVGIRNVIDGVPRQMAREPDLDMDVWVEEIVAVYMRAVRSPDREA